MDPQQITTTFIPKKPLIENSSPERISRPTSLLVVIALLILVISGLGIGGIYLYNQYLTQEIAGLESSLSRAEKSFEPSLLSELTRLDKRLKNADVILNQHMVLSPVFDLIESHTIKTVRFTKFDFKITETKQAVVTLAGDADGYQSIALQSQSLSDISAFRDVIFSDFILTPKKRIAFNISFTVRPDLLLLTQAPLRSTLPVYTPAQTVSSSDSASVLDFANPDNTATVPDNATPSGIDTGSVFQQP